MKKVFSIQLDEDLFRMIKARHNVTGRSFSGETCHMLQRGLELCRPVPADCDVRDRSKKAQALYIDEQELEIFKALALDINRSVARTINLTLRNYVEYLQRSDESAIPGLAPTGSRAP